MLCFGLRRSLYVVRGSSMEPSLFDGDVLLVRRPVRQLRRGDVVVVNVSDMSKGRWQVKRVVGLPEDFVSFECGLLFINGEHHPESYLGGLPADIGARSRSWAVGLDECMVLGDNRAHSTDSRDWGPIPLAHITGVAAIRLWPLKAGRPLLFR